MSLYRIFKENDTFSSRKSEICRIQAISQFLPTTFAFFSPYTGEIRQNMPNQVQKWKNRKTQNYSKTLLIYRICPLQTPKKVSVRITGANPTYVRFFSKIPKNRGPKTRRISLFQNALGLGRRFLESTHFKEQFGPNQSSNGPKISPWRSFENCTSSTRICTWNRLFCSWPASKMHRLCPVSSN